MYENTNGSSEVAVDATIDQDAILFWTGNGQNSAVIAVNWAAPDTCLAWGVKWNGNATVQDLMDTIVAYDSRFTYTGTGSMLSDIIYTADGHTFQLTAESASPWGNYWMYNINGAAAQEMFNTQQVNNGDFVKWGDPNSGIMIDSANWGYVWTTTVTPVSVPTVGIDDVKVAIEALWPNPTTDVVNVQPPRRHQRHQPRPPQRRSLHAPCRRYGDESGEEITLHHIRKKRRPTGRLFFIVRFFYRCVAI